MREYILVLGTDFSQFTAQVSESIASGYEVLGAPILKGDTLIQALVLKPKKATDKKTSV